MEGWKWFLRSKRGRKFTKVWLFSVLSPFSAPGDKACLFLEGWDGMETRLVWLKVLQSGVKVAEGRLEMWIIVQWFVKRLLDVKSSVEEARVALSVGARLWPAEEGGRCEAACGILSSSAAAHTSSPCTSHPIRSLDVLLFPSFCRGEVVHGLSWCLLTN